MNADRLRTILGTVFDMPDLRPKDGLTFCNFAVQRVANAIGYRGFNGMTADAMVALMKMGTPWDKVLVQESQRLANAGHFLVAGIAEEPHGHVCVICPGDHPSIYSGRWAMADIPWCMNIGKDCFIEKGLNYAFKTPPDVFLFCGAQEG